MQEINGLKPGISDGLILPCAICHRRLHFDYIVRDDIWRAVVPKALRQNVICLPCLDRLAIAQGYDIGSAILSIQWTGIGKTLVLDPIVLYRYNPRCTNNKDIEVNELIKKQAAEIEHLREQRDYYMDRCRDLRRQARLQIQVPSISNSTKPQHMSGVIPMTRRISRNG